MFSAITAIAVAQLPSYKLTFYTSPTYCGSITLDGEKTFRNGDSTTVTLGNHDIKANPCYNYRFSRWESTGPIYVFDKYKASTRIAVNGTGSIKADFYRVGGGGGGGAGWPRPIMLLNLTTGSLIGIGLAIIAIVVILAALKFRR